MLLKPFSQWELKFPTLSSEPSSKKARLTLTTDELVVSDDDEIDDTEDFDDSDYLDEGEYEAEEADQWWLLWKAILHLILKTKQSVWSFPQIGR